MRWIEHLACTQRIACAECRSSLHFRRRVLAEHPDVAFVDFACPIGLPIIAAGGVVGGLVELESRTRRRLQLCDDCPNQVLLEATGLYPEGTPSCDLIRNRAGGVCRPEFELQLRSGEGPPGCPWKDLRPPFE